MKVKNILLCTALLSGALFTSCSDFLDEDKDPNALSQSQFWQSEEDIMKGLTAVYAALQPYNNWAESYERYVVIDEYRSDLIDFRDDVTSWMDVAMFTNEATGSVSQSEWTYLYRGINYANQCIDNIPNIKVELENGKVLQKQAVAEARFLRAYFYYRLYLNFGEKVPIYLHQLEGTQEEFYPDQAKPGELVNLIETELAEVQGALPEFYEAEEDRGRATRYTAAAILGKFYMFQGELAKAEAEFKKIIDKGDRPGVTGELFGLMPNWEDNFDGLHKNNKESIFEVQFTGNLAGGHYEGNEFTIHLAPSEGANGYEEAYPTQWLFDTMMKDKVVDASGNETGHYSARTLNTLIFDDQECRPFYYEDGKSFDDYHYSEEDAENNLPKPYYWHKYVTWTEGKSSYWGDSFFNIMVIRYADVLLLYAECLNDRGATTEAIKYINLVRNRVHVKPLESTMTKDEVLKHLQDVERPCELALEGVRWYDLRRWGIAEKTLKDHGKRFMENYVDSKHQLFPIPHSEFLLNPGWEQNPGFSK